MVRLCARNPGFSREVSPALSDAVALLRDLGRGFYVGKARWSVDGDLVLDALELESPAALEEIESEVRRVLAVPPLAVREAWLLLVFDGGQADLLLAPR